MLSKLLPNADQRTTGQLRRRMYKLVVKADPDGAQRRYRAGLKTRRVEHGHDHDGTASLAGRCLPAARAAAAAARIQAIADWVKDGGDIRTVDQIRADVLLDLLQGLPVPGPDGQYGRPVPGDVDTPGAEQHPSEDINGPITFDNDDNEAAGTARTAGTASPSPTGTARTASTTGPVTATVMHRPWAAARGGPVRRPPAKPTVPMTRSGTSPVWPTPIPTTRT